MQMLAGKPWPLGSTLVHEANGEPEGVNFALFSAHATRVELCLFEYKNGQWRESGRFELMPSSQQVFHGLLLGAGEGLCYGYRVHGPYQPQEGHRFNPAKLLLDPYARAFCGRWQYGPWQLGYARVDEQGRPLAAVCHPGDAESPVPGTSERESGSAVIGDDLWADPCDNAWAMPKCQVVADTRFTGKRLPGGQWRNEVIYEMHLKGFTAAMAGIPPELRGTFAGLGHPVVIAYLKSLGITCVELLPVHTFLSEPFLLESGRSNYWGYNSVGFFAPHGAYSASDDAIGEFKQMVSSLHDAGIKLLLDVVFNHSAEGNRQGPTVSFRGLDNLSYYRLHPADKRFYINDSGCGNCLDISHPRVVQLLMDSLRYWVDIMGVDGFRFDLATSLGREMQGFSNRAGLFDALLQDPELQQCVLIAEPWDIGPGGYQLGQFPNRFAEWNDRYRDTLRRFWRGDAGLLPELARRLSGSGDLFEHSGRGPKSSINFICSHDGFTLRDLVSYRERHNQANGENNRDGHHENFSANHGVEGESKDAAILALRARQSRNLLASLLLSQGTPMLLAGDEFGNSQSGNNNAYCQDNPLGWLDWHREDTELGAFVRRLIHIRRDCGFYDSDDYVHTDALQAPRALAWFAASGEAMTPGHWGEVQCRSLQLMQSRQLNKSLQRAESLQLKKSRQLSKSRQLDMSPQGENKLQTEALLILLHAGDSNSHFCLPSPPPGAGEQWQLLLSSEAGRDELQSCYPTASSFAVAAFSFQLLAAGGRYLSSSAKGACHD
ncbi:glycogen debranching protein GlgX [Shewanella algae]|uniref:glycogen debranching protein GlgX n=1 Tax=Shewanella algae TaxID=38313 RepID=UPI001AAC9A97|nr:glycogen debranching protein GlgX [Shewanella algae]MBO2648873.1 glycogen debranching protein GlgX [Shewanella algae]